jgi:hypothetical protein
MPNLQPQYAGIVISTPTTSNPPVCQEESRLELCDFWPSPSKSAPQSSSTLQITTHNKTTVSSTPLYFGERLPGFSTFLPTSCSHALTEKNDEPMNLSTKSDYSISLAQSACATPTTSLNLTTTTPSSDTVVIDGKSYRVQAQNGAICLKPPRGPSRVYCRTEQPRKRAGSASARTDRKRRRAIDHLTACATGGTKRRHLLNEFQTMRAQDRASFAAEADIKMRAYLSAETVLDIKEQGLCGADVAIRRFVVF